MAAISGRRCSSWTIPPREAELAAVAGYLHDVGNGINRLDHGIAAALFSQHVLSTWGCLPRSTPR